MHGGTASNFPVQWSEQDILNQRRGRFICYSTGADHPGLHLFQGQPTWRTFLILPCPVSSLVPLLDNIAFYLFHCRPSWGQDLGLFPRANLENCYGVRRTKFR